MKISDLLNIDNITIQNAFLLGMIYEWPIFSLDFKKIIAYSSYNPGGGSRSIKVLEKTGKTKDEYIQNHIDKLKKFLNYEYVFSNNEIKDILKSTNKQLGIGVSVLIDYDIITPDGLDPEIYLYGIIEKLLIDLEKKYKDYFLLGAMDSRGSLDFTGNFLSIDIAQRDRPDIARRKINKFNDLIGAIFNYNPRLTQENSHKKNDQFRLDLNYFIGNYGFFTPFKIEYYKFEVPSCNFIIKDDFFFLDSNFTGKNLGIKNKDRNIKINELAIQLSKEGITLEEKKRIISDYKLTNLTVDNDDEIEYSSQNMKESAKQNSGYYCEYDSNHLTFISKSKLQNYVEAHHLIPFSERKFFDVSIDIIENIVCLCPNCHRKIHLAVDEEKINLLRPLLNKKINLLHKAGVYIDERKLFSFYKIGE